MKRRKYRAVANILPGLHLAVPRDITERKQAEKALRQSEERFGFLAESIPHMVWVTQPDSSTDYHNARFLESIGDERVSLIANGFPEVFHPDDRRCTSDAWEVAARTGAEFRVAYRIRDVKTGKYRWFFGHTHSAPKRGVAVDRGGKHNQGDRPETEPEREDGELHRGQLLLSLAFRSLIGIKPTGGCRRFPEKRGVYSRALTRKLVPTPQFPRRTI